MRNSSWIFPRNRILHRFSFEVDHFDDEVNWTHLNVVQPEIFWLATRWGAPHLLSMTHGQLLIRRLDDLQQFSI
jgi:hypothetical protein